MSTTIDERVVSMQFDNKKFESNVATSMSTLDKLKQKLNLTDAAKGLENVESAARKCNLSPLSNAVETVGLKFNAMYSVADQVLRNITNSAMTAGKRLISAFTIDPIKSGLSEYETQIGAIQTILANTQSKGSTLDDVNSALDELNKYADKTIYNFTEMTRNIGTFTAAGVGLEESVAAIKGIANLAAVSGSTSQQASTAMYQLSQALASGTVKLQDWNSVVNAGMGGEVFQTALKRTATQMGYNVDAMIEKYGSFRESLTQGNWLTKEVLTETLAQLSGAYTEADLLAQGYSEQQAKEILELAATAESAATDVKTFTQLMDTLKESAQSGWTQTWEILIGDFEEAKALWSGVSNVFGDMINASAEARNKVLGGALSKSTWGEFTTKIEEAGYTVDDFEESVRTTAKEHGKDIDSLVEKYGSFEKAVKSGAIETDILKKSLDGFQKTTNSVDLDGITRKLGKGSNGEDVKKVEAALKSLGYNLYGKDGKDYGYAEDGYFGILTEEAIKDFQKLHDLKVTGMVDEETLAALEKACNTTEKLDDSVYDLIDGLGNLGGREKIIEGISNAFEGVKNIIAPIKKAFREIFPPTTAEQLYSFVEGFTQLTEKFKTWTTSVEGEKVINNLASAFKGFFSIVDIGWTFVKDLAGGISDLLGSILGLGGGIINAAGSLGEWVTGLRDSVKEGDYFGRAIDSIVGFLQKVIDKIKSVSSFLKEKLVAPGWEGFVSVLSAIWDFIQKIGSKIADVGSSIGSVMGNAFRNGDIDAGLDILNGGLLAATLLSIKKFFGGLGDAVGNGMGLLDSIKDVLGSVGDALKTWQQDLKSGILLKIAFAIGILAASVLVLASIDPGRLTAALGAITVLFADLVGSLKLFSTFSKDTKGVARASTAMVAMSTAVLILATALKKIADLSWEDLAKGLVGIVGLSAIMVIVAKALSSNSKKTMKGATQMVIFAAAIKILASVCKDLGSLSWEELAKGLAGVGILLAEVSIFMRTAKFDNKSVSTAFGIAIIAGAIKILASACKDFSQMSWEDIGKGLASVGALLLELGLFTKLTSNAKNMISTGMGLVLIGASMKIFASAIKDLSGMSWEELGKGLAGMAGALLAVTIAMKLMPKNMISMGIGFVAVSAGLLILSKALTEMSAMSWNEIARGLVAMGGSIAILAIGLNLMNGTLAGSAAILIAAAALAILTPVLMALGSMTWGSIAKGLVAIAGAFAIIGVAGLLLAPIVPVILALGGAFALIGVGVLALGAGLTALATGITALAVAGSAAGSAIASFCRGITESIVEIGNMIKALILTVVDVLVECIPAIADGALKLIVGVLDALVEYTPQIVDGIMMFLISALDAVAARTPELVGSVLNVVTSLFAAVTDAIIGLDGSTLAKAGIGVALMAALMALFNVLAPLIPGAVVGILGMGVVIAELAVVLAAIGALSKIPGLTWLVGEGATLMENIGNALGRFVGGLVGGIAQGITSSLPQIGTDLSTFMTNVQPFLDGAAGINQEAIDGVGRLVDVITKITGASLLENITSWLTGSSSMTTFAEQLVPFGTAMKSFADEISGLDEDAVTAAANAGSALATMADTIPNTGGLVAFFAGDNDMATFGAQLVSYGTSLKEFASSVSGIDIAAISDAATASASLVSFAENIPNIGGLVSFFIGDNDMATFGAQLVSYGASLKEFASSVSGIDSEALTNIASASTSLVSLAENIPNTGGLVSFFAGDNDMATFGTQLVAYGTSLKEFATSVSGIDSESLSGIATASTSLISLAENIPNTGGLVTFFTGDNSMTTFGTQLIAYGSAIGSFATSVSGVDSEALSAIASASTSLVSLAENIPNTGGLVTFFTGDNDMTTFGSQLVAFGSSIKSFATSVSGVDSESLSSIATASTSLVSLAENIPNTGGLVTFFTGDNDMGTFGTQIALFGAGIKDFADSVSGIDAVAVDTAISAGTALSTMANSIPDSGGIFSWFSGDKDMGDFGKQLKKFGEGLADFSDEVADIDTAATGSAVTAAESLNTLADTITASGNISNLPTYGDKIDSFGGKIKSFYGKIKGIDTTKLSSITTSLTSLSSISSTDSSGLSSFVDSLGSVGTGGVDAFIKAFDNSASKIQSVGTKTLANFMTGAKKEASKMPTVFKSFASNAATAMKSSYTTFREVGKYLVTGFANGITLYTYIAKNASRKMAAAAAAAAKDELEIRSPSKVGREIGRFFGMGFVDEIASYSSEAYDASAQMASYAKKGLTKAISKVQNLLDSGLETQPTIRPVLDLSDIEAGAGAINGMFGMTPSVGVLSDIGTISHMMNNQNGVTNSDVVSAIKDLGRKIGKTSGDTYNVNGVTYDDGSNINDAVKTLVRAARVERRK